MKILPTPSENVETHEDLANEGNLAHAATASAKSAAVAIAQSKSLSWKPSALQRSERDVQHCAANQTAGSLT